MLLLCPEGVDDWQELAEVSLEGGLKRRPRLTVAEPRVFFRYPCTFGRSMRIDDPSRDFDEFMERRMTSREQLHDLLDDWLAHTGTKEVLVFIHGYNNSFDQAVVIAANVWHFMGKQGVPIAYTWPAGMGGLRGYTADSESGEFTIFHLKLFLEDLASNPDIEKVNILAHSRGTDVTLTAVREVTIAERAAGRDPNKTLKIGTVILASPDIDLEVASQRISSERLPEVADKIPMYISPKDRALRLSNWFQTGRGRAHARAVPGRQLLPEP